jgi:hypothetical protein
MPHTPRAIPPTSPHAARRGSIIVAVIVALVMLQVVVIGVVLLGAREQNLTILRLEASKAQYAAEAGMNMALRELYDSADEDGDGVVGSISNDGNSANDPTVNGASIVVSMTVAGAVTTVTSTASTTSAKRTIVVTLN